MKIIHLVLLVVCSAITWVAQAQEILGLWEIKNVSVGEEAMNPVAKWTRINPDGTYQSGNGWLQNSSGTWTFNEISMEFLPVEDFGIKEDFGAFIVSFSGGKMLWERHEKGMTVLVILEKIQQLPKSTADWITGLWDLTEAIQSGENITPILDPNNDHFIFIRWDRIYVENTPEGDRTTGYWHINSHRPEITFISHEEDIANQSFRVVVNDSELTLEGISDANKNLKVIFKRIDQFPDNG